MVGFATPAMAGAVTVKTEHVRYGDLDLSTAEGVKTLERRVDAAAKRVCDVSPPKPGNLTRQQAGRSCLAKARASARQQVALAAQDSRRGG
jgi:UrcA family protein